MFLTLVVYGLSFPALANGIQEIAIYCNINAGNFIVGCLMELRSHSSLWLTFCYTLELKSFPLSNRGFFLSFSLKRWPFNFGIPSLNYWQFPLQPLSLNLPCLIWFISWFPKYPQKDFWHPPENLPSLVGDTSLMLSSHLRIIALNSLICDISLRSEADRCFKLLSDMIWGPAIALWMTKS